MIATAQLLAALRTGWPATSAVAAEALVPRFTLQTLARGAPVLRPGEVWNAALVIETGLVRQCLERL